MKLPITDTFLMELLGLLNIGEDVVDFALSNKYKQSSIMTGQENPVFRAWRHRMNNIAFSKFVSQLKQRNYIQSANLKGKDGIIFTKKGIDKALKASFLLDLKQQTKRKDRKWIMVAFDVPYAQSRSRDLLRSVLKNLGYKIFQQSIWITPYDVYKKTEQALQFYRLDQYVKMFLIEEI